MNKRISASVDTATAQPIPVEQEFKIMADSVPVMIWIAGLDKACYFFNQGWLQFTGRTMQQEVGNGWTEGVHPDDLERCLDIYTISFDQRIPFKMEYRLQRYDGEYRWILDNGVPRYDEAAQFAGYTGSCIDIQEMKEAEERKNEFISAASHELKTPVTSLNLYLSLLKDFLEENKFDEQKHFAKKAQDQVNKLSNLVSGLLDISKIHTSIMKLNSEPIDYCALVKDIVPDFQASHSSHMINLSAHCQSQVLGDADRLEQVIINLLSNAVKYSPGRQQIQVLVTEQDDVIQTTVTDYGIGMHHEHHNKIFDRFYRITDKEMMTFPGLGIGLFITAEIIKLHGGKIWVNSEENKGTTFTFTLPVQYKKNVDGEAIGS